MRLLDLGRNSITRATTLSIGSTVNASKTGQRVRARPVTEMEQLRRRIHAILLSSELECRDIFMFVALEVIEQREVDRNIVRQDVQANYEDCSGLLLTAVTGVPIVREV